MLDELTFRRYADEALEALKQSLIDAEEAGGFFTEEQAGVINVVFEEPPGKFVVTPNAPVRQIWISALSTSFKLEWIGAASESGGPEAGGFVLPKTGEGLKPLVARLLREHTGDESIRLA